MKIKSIDVYEHDLPVKGGPYLMANANVWSLATTFVRITMDNGAFGLLRYI